MITDSNIMGRNNVISQEQRESLMAFLASDQGRLWNATVPAYERYAIAKHSWVNVEGGREINESFKKAWHDWLEDSGYTCPKSHMWSKGALAITIGA